MATKRPATKQEVTCWMLKLEIKPLGMTFCSKPMLMPLDPGFSFCSWVFLMVVIHFVANQGQGPRFVLIKWGGTGAPRIFQPGLFKIS